MSHIRTRLIRLLSIAAILTSLLLVVSPGFRAYAASSANTSANALCSVITSIGIAKVSDLQFGSATQGDIAKTVDPSSDHVNSASFTVTGEPSTAYDITLPANSTVTMITDDGGDADEIINVDDFASDPSGSGSLDVGGSETLYVGATRAAIRATQVAGSYSGSFSVTVAYQ